MKLDYSGANNAESRRAIFRAYVVRLKELIVERGIKPVTGEERIRQEQELFRKAREQRRQQNQQDEDDPTNVPV